VAPSEEVLDSPVGWVARHVREYVDSSGEKGHRWHGLNALLLTTRGRRSGKLRRTALFYGRDGDRYLVVASNGGKASHPLWYLNLLEQPQVDLQVGGEQFAARARPATAEEQPRLWQMMVDIFPDYARMQPRAARRGRDIPVVVIERLR
jgi:deazaflavin-dependent oxidoreductase (nitroreductase family)